MSKITKDYWGFHQNDDLKPYKLGQQIDIDNEIINFKKISDSEFDYEYLGVEKYLWVLTIERNIITKITFRENFIIPSVEFWNNNYNIICSELKKTLNPVNKDYKGDKMCIICRDNFVSLIILTKGTGE
ncbi:hypothetical protein OX284_000810 [Flavobacterium sp. SUN046]|uniref:hypothetical protein n=1 Tax=Flavobacterium sp. SUN046 TaxID=3002440 RepID=UPI002DBF7B5F|nr:hypothetical protein [Flavobacterium sp. SUN046]MEC4047953.1 hypothetical protein [Flavobacterium sp. SUN046]